MPFQLLVRSFTKPALFDNKLALYAVAMTGGLLLALICQHVLPDSGLAIYNAIVDAIDLQTVLLCVVGFVALGFYLYYLGLVRKNPDTLLLGITAILPWLFYACQCFSSKVLPVFQPFWLILGMVIPGAYVGLSYHRQLLKRIGYLSGLKLVTAIGIVYALIVGTTGWLLMLLGNLVCVALAGASNKTQQEAGRCLSHFSLAIYVNLLLFSVATLLNVPPLGVETWLPLFWLYGVGMLFFTQFGMDKRAPGRPGIVVQGLAISALLVGIFAIAWCAQLPAIIAVGTAFLVMLGLNLMHQEMLHKPVAILLALVSLVGAGLIAYQTWSGIAWTDLQLTPMSALLGHGLDSTLPKVIQENSYLSQLFRFGLLGLIPFGILIALFYEKSRAVLTTPTCYSFRYLDVLMLALITCYLLLSGCSPIVEMQEPIFWILLTLAYIQSKRLRLQWI